MVRTSAVERIDLPQHEGDFETPRAYRVVALRRRARAARRTASTKYAAPAARPIQAREPQPMGNRRGSDLCIQGLRLPKNERDRLAALASHLRAHGSAPVAEARVAEIARGLCALALEIAHGASGRQVADAFRVAATFPNAVGVRTALSSVLALLGVDPIAPVRAAAGAAARSQTKRTNSPRARSGALVNQALRLPHRARDQLRALVAELAGAGVDATPTGVMRGLCLLALELADGAAGADAEGAFRCAACDPTPEGMRRALEAIRQGLDGPTTMPDPPTTEGATSPERSGDTPPPSTLPTGRAKP
jgi:hypothetical protein